MDPITEPLIVIKPYQEWVFTATLVIFAAAMLWESFAPRRSLSEGVIWRWSNNFSLGLLTWYVTLVVNSWLSLAVAATSKEHGLGLLANWETSVAVDLILLLLATQFISYWVHRAFHHFEWLWPIHAVHHTDTDVDVSTSYRHHPLEPIASLFATAPVILLLGPSIEAVFYYRLFAVGANVFSHSNIAIPVALDKQLRKVILTPDYHRIHHCSDSHYTNSNYGSLAPWFDYLFGTAKSRPVDEQTDMELGLEYFREREDSRLDQQLLQPLKLWSGRKEA
ncbi:MAG: sterol desaturase family protein [Halioglobus sp.]